MRRSAGLSLFPRLAGCLWGVMYLVGAYSAVAADLQGRWVGLWYCGDRTTREYFVLDIAGNSARFQVSLGVATVTGTVGGDDIDLKVEQWETRAPPPRNTVTGITGAYHAAAGVMTGKVQANGQNQCLQVSNPLGSAPLSVQTLPRFIAVNTGPVPSRRSNGVSVTLVQFPCRSGWPSAVRGTT